MAQVYNGVAVNFGLTGSVLTGTGVGTGIFQSADHEKKRQKEEISDEIGARVANIWFDPSEEATITYIVKGSGLADAITQTTIPDCGVFVTIATCTQYPALNKTTWEVVGSSVKATNKTVKEVTLKLEFHTSVTAAASA